MFVMLPCYHGACVVICTANLMVCSHCRSDQLDHPDPLNSPIKPDQARLKGVYMTSSRHPIVDHRRSFIPTYKGSRSQTLVYPHL